MTMSSEFPCPLFLSLLSLFWVEAFALSIQGSPGRLLFVSGSSVVAEASSLRRGGNGGGVSSSELSLFFAITALFCWSFPWPSSLSENRKRKYAHTVDKVQFSDGNALY